MSYKYYLNISDQSKAIIHEKEKNDNILSNNKSEFNSPVNSKNVYLENKRKEREEQKELIIKMLEDLNTKANKLMDLVSKFLQGSNSELREQIKSDFKNLKDKMKAEYKKINAARYYGNIVEKAFYIPAINESWVKISGIQYNRIPSQALLDAVYDVEDYTNYYLTDLRDCNIMELGK